MNVNWTAIRAEVGFFLIFFAVFMVFRTAAYGMYYIPSESMLPTLAVGDRILVNKTAYGYSRHSLPFSLAPDFPTGDGRIFSNLPDRGDVVVFKHPATGATMIKRVVGLPGDEIAVIGGALIVNGVAIDAEFDEIYDYREKRAGRRRADIARVAALSETLGDKRHAVLDRGDGYPGDDFGPVVAPEGALIVLGDNRDNSLDSRFQPAFGGVGFVPVDRLVGRADAIVFSVNFDPSEPGLKRHAGKWFTKL